jgi:hypothetical protein
MSNVFGRAPNSRLLTDTYPRRSALRTVRQNRDVRRHESHETVLHLRRLWV